MGACTSIHSGVISILSVNRDGDDAILVTFTDGPTAAYVAEELLELRPYRESTLPAPASLKPPLTRTYLPETDRPKFLSSPPHPSKSPNTL